MKTRTLLLICTLFFLLIVSCNTAFGQDIITLPTEKVYVSAIETVSITGPHNEMERAWVLVELGTVGQERECEIGSPQVTIAVEIWPEYYVDEILSEAIDNDYVYCEPDPNERVEMAGGMETILEFASILEPMLQSQWITYNNVDITGIVSGPIDLYGALNEARNEVIEPICFIPDGNGPLGQWYASCQLYMPVVIQ